MHPGKPGSFALPTLLICGLAAADPRPADTGVEDPHVDYMLHCQGCHLPDGAGSTGLVPGLRSSVGELAGSAEGRDYLLRVPGSSQSRLSDERLAALYNWIINTWNAESRPKDFRPFTAEEVQAARRHPLIDAAAKRKQVVGMQTD